MKKVYLIFFLCCVISVFLVAGSPREGGAVEKWMVVGSTVWIAEGNNLALDFPETGPNDLRVKQAAAGGNHWIKTSPLIPFGSRIKQVILCYKTPNAGTVITQIRLGEYVLTTAPILRDISPIPESSTGTCYVSTAFDMQPAGSLYVGLRFTFANPSDSVVIGALGLLIDE